MLHRYFLKLSYHGAEFSGWQFQPNAPSVQEALEKTLTAMLHEKITVVGCGRTDAGVHASQYFAHIDATRKDLHSDPQFIFRLNKSLPDSIAIHAIYSMPENAHARFSAVSRSYTYVITKNKNAIHKGLAWEMHEPLNIALMNEAAQIILHYDDFISFSKTGGTMKTSICRIAVSEWKEEGEKIIYTITSNRFLRNMVRMIVGTLVEVGKGNMQTERVKELLDAKKQPALLHIAPANGLFLSEVKYNFPELNSEKNV
jgi:tRNA pseudouridine38-40 synthase